MVSTAILQISATQIVMLVFVLTEYNGQAFSTPDFYLIFWFRNPTHILIVLNDVP
jgi:hypothetical protein